MIVDGCEDLHHEFSAHLEAQKSGPHTMLKWTAERSNARWYQTIIKMIQRMMGPETTDRLMLSKPSAMHVFDPDNDLFRKETMLVQQYFDLILCLSVNRAWSQAHFGLVFPYCLSRIMGEQDDRTRAQTLLRTLVDGILKLEDRAKTAHKKSSIHRLLTDLGTTEWVITREIFVQGLKVDWNPQDPELRKIAFTLGAGPTTTKYCLENVINTVKDAGQRVQKNTKHMSMFTKWMYAATSNHAAAGGVEQLQVDRNDLLGTWLRDTNIVSSTKEFGEQQWLAKAKSGFKEVFPAPEQILHETRKAGYLANKRAAAAAAYILQDGRRDFLNVEKAWTGPALRIGRRLLLTFKKHIYIRKNKDQA